jgi:hypothetical protein
VVRVYDDFLRPRGFQVIDITVQEGTIPYGHEGFGEAFRERFKPSPETGGKDHGLHSIPFSVANS